MTHELIIEGQHVDLAPNTDITLEYVSNIIGDVSKINLSHSYTIKLPKTLRNARVLDDPGRPGHDSTKGRRYLSAEYYRNGIDLIGPAQAYLLKVSSDSYEVALIWNRIPALSELSAAKPKLPDLKGLPELKWDGAPWATANTTDGCFFARYYSGTSHRIGSSVNDDPYGTTGLLHPSVTLYELITRIFSNAGIPYRIGVHLSNMLKNHALLVAPSHKPSFDMELAAGAQADSLNYIYTMGVGDFWWFQGWQTGWDAPGDGTLEAQHTIQRGPTKEMRFYLNMQIYGQTPDLYIELNPGGSGYILQPTRTEDGGYLLDAVVDLESELGLTNETDYFTIAIQGLTPNGYYQYNRYDTSRPLFAIMRPHETIPVDHQNLFPVGVNLPNIGQMDFIKSVLGLFGAVIVPYKNSLVLEHFDDILLKRLAVDWTSKVDMREGIKEYSGQLKDFAQKNRIKYEPDVSLPVSPDLTLVMEDQTATLEKDWLKLPFAASRGNQAIHQKYNHDGGEVEYLDIKPRIFGYTYSAEGYRYLTFPETLAGDRAVKEYHNTFQSILRKPVTIEVNVRLHELDLAQLDLTNPVYLGQYGQYYAIIKIQTSDTDLCKVELLQLI
ncbi:MAG: hypothetical protein U0K19_04950 [Bifidobacteriaceae bacterium]|nr:hypothetical protein [Bifidobacteriaceae bacterium]